MIKSPRIEIYGSLESEEIKAEVERLTKYGYSVEVKSRPDDDITPYPVGPCGCHCNCTVHCEKNTNTLSGG